ncbi:MAG: Asp-tRNA(Asn)/Glu-tRNA(Gln) amidotransferase subunit GatB [Candidatus Omnitrophota bacterium]
MYEPVIGLEVHVQLKTKTKAFCGCVNEFGARENTNICPVCLGLPGALPVLNAQAIKSSAKVALALGCTVRTFTKFDRKNYFYPDLPKNFQISQYDMPLSEHGFLDIETPAGVKQIRIKRVHLEEDAGKLIHDEKAPFSYVDFNRAGTPLLEIVTEPDLNTPQEAYLYLTDLKLILQYLGVSDCDMEKGTLRCDANVSVRKSGDKTLGTKAELKNMNSFKAVKGALEYEILRQTRELEGGGRIVQETRLWNEKKAQTFSMRSKEEAHDYRYFPEPDLPPFVFSQDELNRMRQDLPELPKQRCKRLVETFGLTAAEAATTTSDKDLADFFEACCKISSDFRKIVHWLIGPVLFEMNSRNADVLSLGLTPAQLVRLVSLVEDNTISQLTAKDVLSQMLDEHKDPDLLIQEKNLAQVSDAGALNSVIEEVVRNNKKSVDDYLAGKENALMFLVGQVMKMSKGKANPKMAKDLLAERLKL